MMRNLLKLKLKAVLWTKFLFRHALGYFQVFVKKKNLSRFFWHTLMYIYKHDIWMFSASQFSNSRSQFIFVFYSNKIKLDINIKLTDKLSLIYFLPTIPRSFFSKNLCKGFRLRFFPLIFVSLFSIHQKSAIMTSSHLP